MRKTRLFSILALLLMAVTGAWAQKDTPLTLKAMTAGTIKVTNPPAGMQYKKNEEAKTAVTSASINVAKDDVVQFFGSGTSITSYYNNYSYTIIGGTADCYIYGNIMSLVDEYGYATATTLTGDNAFGELFSGNSHLYNHPTYKLVLPATTLTESCYYSMFLECTNLTTAPELPATTLAVSCYHYMFLGCTNLTTAPELPATTLADYCYLYMFSNCTNLTTAPALPATTLANNCYNSMFYGCTSLTTAPALPATTLAEGCYYNMFKGCTQLNSVTCLATISATDATYNWLSGVAATGTFTKAPGMEGWTTGASGIPSEWTVVDNVVDMKKTPLTLEAKTPGTIVVSSPQSGMQYSRNGGATTAVTSDPIDVAAGETVQFFGSGTSIARYNGTRISGGTADCYIYGNIMSLVDENGYATATTLTGDYAFQELFNGNSHLYNHDTYELVLPATTLTENCYRYMFKGCTSLTTAPELPATTLADDCYDSMFDGCTSLTTAPALPATTLKTYCYYNMFYGCTSLTVAPELPATTLAYGCYAYMFEGCTSLTTAPALPATTLETRCYNNMFKGCTKLNSVTCLATDISASNATANWLSGVAATGTFTKAAGMTDWELDNASGIPSGWTKNNIATLTDGSSIVNQLKCPGESCTLTYTRAFTEDKPSTVCLPFAYAPKTGEKFYTFSDITKVGDEYVATMTEHTGATLAANTPYMYKSATTGVTDFSGTYTIPATIAAGTTTSGDWTFVGTYDTQSWTTAPTGIYGFSAQNTTGGISQGEFVKVGAYVRIKPMRAYLKYKNGGENYAGAPMMAPRRAAETLPERISVRLIDADGNVTGIGTLETRTGEVTLDGWYTLDGTRLSGQPTRKGIYVNNGKKVIIK